MLQDDVSMTQFVFLSLEIRKNIFIDHFEALEN